MGPLGWHWMATAEGCELKALSDTGLLAQLLTDLSRASELTPVSSPVVHSMGSSGPVGVILLAESHASVHVNLAARALFVDIFSCVYFSADRAAIVLREALNPERITERLLERGPSTEIESESQDTGR